MTASKQTWQSESKPNKIVVNDQIYVKTIVHRFFVDLDIDTGIYVGTDIYDWEQSEMGKWVIENSLDKPTLVTHEDITTYRMNCAIVAFLLDRDHTFFQLKWNTQ